MLKVYLRLFYAITSKSTLSIIVHLFQHLITNRINPNQIPI